MLIVKPEFFHGNANPVWNVTERDRGNSFPAKYPGGFVLMTLPTRDEAVRYCEGTGESFTVFEGKPLSSRPSFAT